MEHLEKAVDKVCKKRICQALEIIRLRIWIKALIRMSLRIF